MKNLLVILGVLVLFSFTAVDGVERSVYPTRMVAPLQQKAIIVTGSYKKMKLYIKRGWVVEDVDVVAMNASAYDSKIWKYYTLVKY